MEKVIGLIQAAFHEGHLTEKCTWQTVVLIPKGNGNDIRGIGLMDVLWKTMTGILNLHLSMAIQFHDKLHVFCIDRGIGTAPLDAELLQKLTVMR